MDRPRRSMPKISSVRWQDLVRVFEQDGFERSRQSGSHLVLVKEGVGAPVVIPKHRSVKVPIIRSNMRTAGMSRERYFRLLKNV